MSEKKSQGVLNLNCIREFLYGPRSKRTTMIEYSKEYSDYKEDYAQLWADIDRGIIITGLFRPIEKARRNPSIQKPLYIGKNPTTATSHVSKNKKDTVGENSKEKESAQPVQFRYNNYSDWEAFANEYAFRAAISRKDFIRLHLGGATFSPEELNITSFDKELDYIFDYSEYPLSLLSQTLFEEMKRADVPDFIPNSAEARKALFPSSVFARIFIANAYLMSEKFSFDTEIFDASVKTLVNRYDLSLPMNADKAIISNLNYVERRPIALSWLLLTAMFDREKFGLLQTKYQKSIQQKPYPVQHQRSELIPKLQEQIRNLPSFRMLGDQGISPVLLPTGHLEDKSESLPLENYLKERWTNSLHKKHLCIIGEGGIGKTVSILHCLTDYRDNGANPWKIPAIYIPLNRLGSQVSSSYADIDSYLDANYDSEKEEIQTLSANQWINHPSLILFLDGYNEMTDSARDNISTSLEIWAQEKPGIQIIITSRTFFEIPGAAHLQEVFILNQLSNENASLRKKKTSLDEYIQDVFGDLLPEKIIKSLKTPFMVQLFFKSEQTRRITAGTNLLPGFEWHSISAPRLPNEWDLWWNYLLSEAYKVCQLSRNEIRKSSVVYGIFQIRDYSSSKIIRVIRGTLLFKKFLQKYCQ